MAHINNYSLLTPFLTFPSDDIFYYLQIIQRKKDHPSLLKDTHVIKVYYIKSLKDLSDHSEEIIVLCKVFKARAMLNMNARSFKKCSLEALRILAEDISKDDFIKGRRVFDHACGLYSAGHPYIWIVDVDDPVGEELNILTTTLSLIQPVGDKIVATVPTVNGCHLLTHPFDRKAFGDKYKDRYHVHTNNPTLLYYDSVDY